MYKLIHGSDGGTKVKVYKNPASSFIRCHEIESNYESIFRLQEDETIQDGIFRDRWDDGNTSIGSKYFCRSGRQETREYRLYRVNESGDIDYYDRIFGKGDSDWRYLAIYSFNPEMLGWTKHDV